MHEPNPVLAAGPKIHDAVVADPHARYFGATLGERSLIPAADARLGEIGLDEWLNQGVRVATGPTGR